MNSPSSSATTLQPTSSSSSSDVHVDLGALPMRSATTKSGDLTVYSAPAADAKPIETLAKITEYKQPRTLLAFDQYQDYLRVYLPTRPNSSTGWVKASDVNVSGPLLKVKKSGASSVSFGATLVSSSNAFSARVRSSPLPMPSRTTLSL